MPRSLLRGGFTRFLSTLIAVSLWLILLPSASAQVFQAYWNFADFTGTPFGINTIQINPLAPSGVYSNYFLAPTQVASVTTTNGSFTTPMVAGYCYLITFTSQNDPRHPLYITNVFPLGTSGSNNAINFVGTNQPSLLPSNVVVGVIFANTNAGSTSTSNGVVVLSISNASNSGVAFNPSQFSSSGTTNIVSGALLTNVILSGGFQSGPNGAFVVAPEVNGGTTLTVIGEGGASPIANFYKQNLTSFLQVDPNANLFLDNNEIYGPGTISNVMFTNIKSGNISNLLVGTISGNGGGLTNLNASVLASGIVPLSVLSSAVLTNNQPAVSLGSVNGSFTGTALGVTNAVNQSSYLLLGAPNACDSSYIDSDAVWIGHGWGDAGNTNSLGTNINSNPGSTNNYIWVTNTTRLLGDKIDFPGIKKYCHIIMLTDGVAKGRDPSSGDLILSTNVIGPNGLAALVSYGQSYGVIYGIYLTMSNKTAGGMQGSDVNWVYHDEMWALSNKVCLGFWCDGAQGGPSISQPPAYYTRFYQNLGKASSDWNDMQTALNYTNNMYMNVVTATGGNPNSISLSGGGSFQCITKDQYFTVPSITDDNNSGTLGTDVASAMWLMSTPTMTTRSHHFCTEGLQGIYSAEITNEIMLQRLTGSFTTMSIGAYNDPYYTVTTFAQIAANSYFTNYAINPRMLALWDKDNGNACSSIVYQSSGNIVTYLPFNDGSMLIGLINTNLNTMQITPAVNFASGDSISIASGAVYNGNFQFPNNYYFESSFTNTDANNIAIGGTLNQSLQNLVYAINATGTPGVNYGSGTTNGGGVVYSNNNASATVVGNTIYITFGYRIGYDFAVMQTNASSTGGQSFTYQSPIGSGNSLALVPGYPESGYQASTISVFSTNQLFFQPNVTYSIEEPISGNTWTITNGFTNVIWPGVNLYLVTPLPSVAASTVNNSTPINLTNLANIVAGNLEGYISGPINLLGPGGQLNYSGLQSGNVIGNLEVDDNIGAAGVPALYIVVDDVGNNAGSLGIQVINNDTFNYPFTIDQYGTMVVDAADGGKGVIVTNGGNISIGPGGMFQGNGAGLTNTFNDSTNASITGNGHGVTNTSTKYGTAIIVATAQTFSNMDSGGNWLITNTAVTGTYAFPVGPKSGVGCVGGGLTSSKVIFQ